MFVEDVAVQAFPAIIAQTIADWDTFRADLAQTRERGYAIASEELELGLVAVSAPLLNYDNNVVAAICLDGLHTRVPPERIPQLGQLVRAAARRISVQLGYAPEK